MGLTGLDPHRQDVTAGTGAAAPARPPDQLRRVPPLPAGQRACCCPAQAFVRVLVPAGGPRPKPTDLYLCAHHFRAGRAALTRIGAVAFDGRGAEMTRSSPVFLPWETPGSAGGPASPVPTCVPAG